MKRFFSPRSLLLTGVALLGIALCLVAAHWQWHRGQVRSHQNSIIAANQRIPPLSATDIAKLDPEANQWRTVRLSGSFDSAHQLLLRNRYFEGQYGFEVLNLFRTTQGENIWVDRGWVKAGSSASVSPQIPATTNGSLSIDVRIRTEDISHQVEGSLFALPSSSKRGIDLSSAQGVAALKYYADLLASSGKPSDLLSPISLPELTNGPHFAYALQWLLFALLFLIGRILLFRESK